MSRFIIILLLFATAAFATAQEVQTVFDTDITEHVSGASSQNLVPLDHDQRAALLLWKARQSWDSPLWNLPPSQHDRSMTLSFPQVALIGMWRSGAFYADGAREYLPGLMGHVSGSLNLVQHFGPVTFRGAVTADKYAGFRSLNTIYGVSGQVSWHINDALSLTMFGSYSQGYHPDMYMSPAMMGYIGTSNYGGYLSINMGEHWGVDVGAQSSYQPWNGQWHARPIVRPYYRLKDDVKLGVDVGGILYEVIRSSSGNDMFGRSGNPTIGPPINMGPPPVR